jgi:hypothetical protein
MLFRFSSIETIRSVLKQSGSTIQLDAALGHPAREYRWMEKLNDANTADLRRCVRCR